MNDKTILKRCNVITLILSVIVLVLGRLSRYFELLQLADGNTAVRELCQDLLYLGIGCIIVILISIIGTNGLKKENAMYVLGSATALLVFLSFFIYGESVNSLRLINLGIIQLSFEEVSPLLFMLWTAFLMERFSAEKSKQLLYLWGSGAAAVVFLRLNFGRTVSSYFILLLCYVLTLLVIEEKKWLLAATVIIILLVVLLFPRFLRSYPDVYFVPQIRNAFADAGWLGHGLKAQTIGRDLSFSTGDFAFVVICQQFGWIAGSVVLTFMGAICWQIGCIARIEHNMSDLFKATFSVAVAVHVGLLTIANLLHLFTNLVLARAAAFPLLCGNRVLLPVVIELGLALSFARERG